MTTEFVFGKFYKKAYILSNLYNNCTSFWDRKYISVYSSLLELFLNIYIPFPIHCVFIEIEPRSKAGNSSKERKCGRKDTLRLRSTGPVTVEEVVCDVYLVPLLLGHVQTFMFTRAGNKGKIMSINKMPYTLIKAWTLIHCLLKHYENY